MSERPLVVGEFKRALDDRYRISIPPELLDALAVNEGPCALAKERPGALSLWDAEIWRRRLDESVQLVQAKIRARKLEDKLGEVQRLGRLLSTRHREVQLAGRGRLVIPEGFREFLGVEPGGDVLLVGAAVCVEIWRPSAWIAYLNERIPEFESLLSELSA